MTTTIQHGASSIPVDFLLGFTTEREHGNILHPVLGRGDVEVTFKVAGLRSGTFKFLCNTFAKAAELEAEHAEVGVFTMLNDELPSPGISMVYVPSGRITVEAEGSKWIVSCDFQEVTP
jgi:hypothetical protein